MKTSILSLLLATSGFAQVVTGPSFVSTSSSTAANSWIGPHYTVNTPVSVCFQVNDLSIRPDGATFQALMFNKCPYEIDHVYVLVKFMDASGARIDVSSFAVNIVESGETIKHVFVLPRPDIKAVKVRRITTNVIESVR